MFPSKRPTIFLTLTVAVLTALSGCVNSQAAKNLEQSLAADPQLQDNPIAFGESATPTNNQNNPNPTTANLPSDFPSEIPTYPEAQLQEVSQTSPQSENTSATATLTRWNSSDPVNFVQSYYQQQLKAGGWEILSQPTDQTGGTFEARRNNLKVTVAIAPISTNTTNTSNPSPTPSATQPATEFTIEYLRDSTNAAAQPIQETTASATPTPTTSATPTPTTQATPTPAAENTTNPNSPTSTATTFTDISKAPPELRSYISDLAQLGVITVKPSNAKGNESATGIQFEPNKPITRREFARWLVAANNRINANNPAKQIRLATESNQPTFTDVSRTNPDFPAIQGLAEAGLIPSPLSGDSAAVLFRPDAPLTREQMMLWKVPLDTRQLPSSASLETVKQTWGFQDVTKIDPKALRAILGDYQNGDTANIRRVFGYTTLFQPKKGVTRAEAAASLWYFGTQNEGISAKEISGLKNEG
ncbi:MAG TPA: S-layer homology domain-containing protein [Leptolyngbyaceae cyanobacterium]